MKRSRLWAVTCLFNPAGYRSRRANYHAFRAALKAPLMAVELSFDGSFELDAGDADLLLRVDGGDVLWQKERLLNLALPHLPDDCDAVAVLDADVLFAEPGWVDAALEQLDESPVVQLYSEVHELARDPTSCGSQGPVARRVGVAHAMKRGADALDVLGPQAGDGRGAASPGHAWAYRRSLLERHGLFDGCVIGGGDTAIACATWGAFAAVERRHAMNAAQQRYYREWAEPWFADVRGRASCLEGEIGHLWHGDMQQRGAGVRHAGLAQHAFDPGEDLASEGGAWRWASEKPEMHRYLREYFASRREDG